MSNNHLKAAGRWFAVAEELADKVIRLETENERLRELVVSLTSGGVVALYEASGID